MDYDEVIMRRSWRQHEASRELAWEALRWVAIAGFLLVASKANAHDFVKKERFMSGPLRVAPYPLMQIAPWGGATVYVTVFVEPMPAKRHLRVEWFADGALLGGAERDLDEESPVQFDLGPAKGVPPGSLTVVATIRERFQNGTAADTFGKVLNRIERKAIVAGGEE